MNGQEYGWTGAKWAKQKEELLNQILPIEWQMFSKVNEGIAQQASCQQMPRTFVIMRAAQALSWTVAVMESYLEDLTRAAHEGRNIMTEKYGRMMQQQGLSLASGPSCFPDVSPDVQETIEQIVETSLEWRRQVSERFPKLVERGRVMAADDEMNGAVSFETYLRGELETYSPKTVDLYAHMVEIAETAGVNLEEECLRNMVSAYGFQSIEEAERSI